MTRTSSGSSDFGQGPAATRPRRQQELTRDDRRVSRCACCVLLLLLVVAGPRRPTCGPGPTVPTVLCFQFSSRTTGPTHNMQQAHAPDDAPPCPCAQSAEVYLTIILIPLCIIVPCRTVCSLHIHDHEIPHHPMFMILIESDPPHPHHHHQPQHTQHTAQHRTITGWWRLE